MLSQPPQCLCHLAVPEADATHSEHKEYPQRTAVRPPTTEFGLVLCALVKMRTRQRLQQCLRSPPPGDSCRSHCHWFLMLGTACPHEAMQAVEQGGWVQGRFHPGLHHSFDTYQRVPWASYLTTICLSFSINKMEITRITTYSCKGERSWYLCLDKFLRQSVLTDVLVIILSF